MRGTLAVRAVEAGGGAAALSASVAAVGTGSGLLDQAGVTLPGRDAHVLCHIERHGSRAADVLTAIIAGRAP